jgi:hypothetical protein
MITSVRVAPLVYGSEMDQTSQSLTVAAALILALRSPDHAAPVLRPIADELEARK